MSKLIEIYGFTWKKRFVYFISIFGVIWSLISSLLAFIPISNFLLQASVPGYAGLLFSSGLLTWIAELIFRFKQTKNTEFVRLTIELITTGNRYKLMVPFDLKISIFITQLATYLEKRHNYPHLKWTLDFSAAILSVKRVNNFELLDNNLTLREANLENGDLCRIANYDRKIVDKFTLEKLKDIIPNVVHIKLNRGKEKQIDYIL